MKGSREHDSEGTRIERRVPRRGIRQQVSLITGAFVAGVFRLDEALAESSRKLCFERALKRERCCSLCSTSDPTSVRADCTSFLYWACGRTSVTHNELYGCIECYNVNIV